MGILDATIIHHVGMVLAFIWALSWFVRCHAVVYLLCLVYLYAVNERCITRLQRRLQFEERKRVNQRRLLSDTETVRWLNHAVEKVWPICMEQIASQQILLPIIPWFLEKYKPWTAKKAVVQHLYLGRKPPVFTEIRVLGQSADDDHMVLELGMNFLSADDMSAILAVKLRKRLGFGMWAKMHVTGMHVEGRVSIGLKFLRKWPFLGRLRLCFVEPPFFQMTVKPIFSYGLDVAELPGIAGWLDKLLAAAFEETLVEPNMLVVNVEKFVSSPTEDWFTMDVKSAIAYAKVEILEAADMKPSDLNGLADPYIKGHLGAYRFQTKIQRKTLAPKWLEEFMIPITSWEGANVLVLEVRDKDHIFDDMLGDCSVSIGELRGGQRHDTWLTLKNIKMGRLHLAITVLEGAAADVASAKVKECGNDEQRDKGERMEVSEDTTSTEAAKSNLVLNVPEPHMKAAGEYEPINIEGQDTTGIWVHHPGSDVSQRWQPRKGRERHPDAELLREDNDCTDSRRSVVSGSQHSDSSSNDGNPDGHKVHSFGTIRKGVKKVGSLFHRSPRSESPNDSVDPLPTLRPNLRGMGERSVSVKLVLDENVSGDIGKDHAGLAKKSPGKEEPDSPGKGHTKEMAKSILKHVGKSAHHLKSVLSRKGSKSKKGKGHHEDVDSPCSDSSSGEESPTSSKEHVFLVDGVSLVSAFPSACNEQTPIEMEAPSANEATTKPDSPTLTLREFKSIELDGHGVNSPVSTRDVEHSLARKVSFKLAGQGQGEKAAEDVSVYHSSEGSPSAGT
uniref:C2 domain-containing protein At1g53590 n=2 Tax=Anthurium amnicola TaxID=1678845 RepID=A0A1D1YGC2_9ARAE